MCSKSVYVGQGIEKTAFLLKVFAPIKKQKKISDWNSMKGQKRKSRKPLVNYTKIEHMNIEKTVNYLLIIKASVSFDILGNI